MKTGRSFRRKIESGLSCVIDMIRVYVRQLVPQEYLSAARQKTPHCPGAFPEQFVGGVKPQKRWGYGAAAILLGIPRLFSTFRF